jgi:hypothetical protein
MLKIAAIGAVLLFAACGSGDSGCGGSEKKDSGGESSSMPGGGGTGGGGLGEPVSFQGVGKKQEPPPPQQAPASSAAPAEGQAAPASSGGGNGGGAAPADGPQSVICGGFPDLAADCFKDPDYEKIKKKCCPTGQVEQCQGIPGGARLIGRGCTAAAK